MGLGGGGGGEDTVTDSGALSSSHLTLINDCAPRGKKIETGLPRASRHATPRRLEPLTSQYTWCSGTQQSPVVPSMYVVVKLDV